MKKALWFVVLLSVLAISACGPGVPAATPTPTEPQGDAAAGKIAYDKTCIACHGIDLKGMPNLGKDLTTSEFLSSQTNTQMVEFLKIGRSASDPLNTTKVDMPPRGGNPALTDQDLLNIVAYLRSMHVK